MPFDDHGPAALPVSFRAPRPADARQIWQLARGSGALDENSGYAYALLCTHFHDTCIVAEDGDALAGFVVGYRPPRAPDTVFVWQIGVAAPYRGRGVGVGMLVDLLAGQVSDDVRFLEATVTPSNEASQLLFRSVARRLGAPCEVRPFLAADLLPETGHEPEELYRIGPLTPAPAPAH